MVFLLFFCRWRY